MSKLRVGIDINEVLRAKWLQFDRFYAQEFGEENTPENQPLPYTYDYFNTYRWKDTVEKIQELKEPEEMPDNINPTHYQVDKKTGEADADAFILKKEEETKLTAKEVYNRFMYEDYCFEIHGSATMMYKDMDVHVNKFNNMYSNHVEFVLLSVENYFSIPPTLFFLSKTSSRFKEYKFVDESIDMWKHVDVLITTDPKILKLNAPWGKKLIKIKRPYNEDIKAGSLEVLQINDLIDNKKFEKIIKYNKKK